MASLTWRVSAPRVVCFACRNTTKGWLNFRPLIAITCFSILSIRISWLPTAFTTMEQSETKQRRPCRGHPTTVRKGCGLQDLCEDDRAKLTRLIFELATTQQALSDLQRAQTNNHAVSPYYQNISSTTLKELSSGRTVLCNRNSSTNSESDHKCPSLPSDEGASYRSRLTCLETELQEIRSLLTKQAIDEDNSRPHMGESASTRISTPNEPVLTRHRKTMIPKGNSETPTCTCVVAHLRDKGAKSVETSDASVSVVAPIKLRDASVSAIPPDDQQPREKLLFERDTLRRQQRVLSVVAKQQAQLHQLTGQVQVITASMFAPKPHQSQNSNRPSNSVVPLHTEDAPLSYASQNLQTPSTVAPAPSDPTSGTVTFQPTTGVEFTHQTATTTSRRNSRGVNAHGTLTEKASTMRSLKTAGVQTVVTVTRRSETQTLSPTPSLNGQLSSESEKLARSIEANTPIEVVVDAGYHARQPDSAAPVFGAESAQVTQSTPASKKDRTELNLDLDDIQKVLTLIEEIHSISPVAHSGNRAPFCSSTNQLEHRAWTPSLSCRRSQLWCTPGPILDPVEEQLLSDLFFTNG